MGEFALKPNRIHFTLFLWHHVYFASVRLGTINDYRKNHLESSQVRKRTAGAGRAFVTMFFRFQEGCRITITSGTSVWRSRWSCLAASTPPRLTCQDSGRTTSRLYWPTCSWSTSVRPAPPHSRKSPSLRSFRISSKILHKNFYRGAKLHTDSSIFWEFLYTVSLTFADIVLDQKPR